MSISCRYSDAINFADPAYITGADVTVGTVAETPVALIRPEALLARQDEVRDGIQDMLTLATSDSRRHERNLWERMTLKKPGMLESRFRLMNTMTPRAVNFLKCSAQESQKTSGYAMPHAYSFVENDSSGGKSNICSFVKLAPQSFTLGHILPFEKSSLPPSLSAHGKAFRYIVNCHEIAHAAGADEAQADYIAILMCRRTFGDNAAPAMMADMRATTIVADSAREKPHVRAESDYGVYDWNMVEAIDEACAIPLATVKAMNDTQIFAYAHHRRPDAVMRTSLLSHTYAMAAMALADERSQTEIAHKASRMAAHYGTAAAIPADMRAALATLLHLNTAMAKLKLASAKPTTEEMHEAATLTARALTGGNITPECAPMGRRLALATARLSRGAEAYEPRP